MPILSETHSAMNCNVNLLFIIRYKSFVYFLSAFIIAFFCILSFDASAQKFTGTLHLKSGDVIVKENISDDGIKAELNKGKWNNQTFAVLVFDQKPTLQQLQRIANSGVEFLHYLPDNAYQVRFRYTASSLILKDAGVQSVVQLTGPMKFGKNLQQEVAGFQPSSAVVTISLQLLPGISFQSVSSQLTQQGFVLTKNQFINGGLLIGDISVGKLNELAALPFVSFVNLADFTPQPLNHIERSFYGLTALSSSQVASRQLSGTGVSIGVGDDADPTSHLDNKVNLINRSPNIISGSTHGTIVTSNVGGDGIIRERFVGTAPFALIVTDYFDYIVSKTPTYISDYGMTVANNSYYNGVSGCAGDGDYNELSAYIDDLIYNNQQFQHIFAVGNDGTLTCAPYPAGFGTVKSGYQSAKNVLSVGGWNIGGNTLGSYSSAGPVLDGRIKPEIVASGSTVEGTGLNNTYTLSSGTSFAAPGVTGIWALLTERYKQINGVNPKSALLKNVLCNTATDRGNAGPDYRTGFGSVNAQRAINLLEESRYYSNTVVMSATHSQAIAVPAGVKQLKVMLYWHDKPGSPNNPNALENDLDLTVTDGVTTYTPMVLNAAPASVNAPAVQGIDHINNIEQVVISNPGLAYTVNVNGFNVTGSQEFFVSYEYILPELKLLYPYGGERFLTIATEGRSEIITWEANDNSNDTYRIEYSLDDGSTWQLIADGVSSAALRYVWSVPSINSNKAKVRIKRSSGSVFSTTPGNFVISDLASVTPTVPCEGYVDLNWIAVPGATDYQVMQLMNGAFSVIGNTNSTSYRVSGLDRNLTYWFSIRPRLGDSLARRANAKSIVPSFSSPCTNTAFDNDLKIDTLLTSVTARKFTSTQYTASQNISVRIKNLDNAASSTGYTISYQVNGGPIVNENPGISIAAGGILDYTFTATYNFSAAGNYTLRVFVTQAGDLQNANNEQIYNLRHLANTAIILPVVEDFESTGSNDLYTSAFTGLINVDRFDFQPSSANGRLRTYVNSGMQINGNRSLYMDAAQFTGTANTNTIIATYNMSDVASNPGLRFDFKVRNQGQLNSSTTNYVWMRGQDNLSWVQVYNLTANQGELGEVKRVTININDIMTNTGQPITSSFQVKFDQSGSGTANNGSYTVDGDLDDGFAFDDIRIAAATNDVTVTQLVAPTTFNCGAGASSPVTIRVRNTTTSPLLNVPVFYRVDNGTPVAGNIPSIAGNSTLDYTFPTPADLSVFKQYDIETWVQLPGDDYPLNDSVTNQLVHNSPVVTSYPYLERFETTNGNFFTTGNYSSWKWGSTDPSRIFVKKAANGTKAWFTNLTGGYKNNENSYLYSPCYNLSSLTTPMLSFAHISQQEDNFDYHTVEYTTDNGVTWQRLGLQNGGTNWFSSSTLTWRFSISRWHVSSVVIPTNASSVRFRFLLNSDVFTQGEGIGIDDIRIGEAQTIYSGANVTGITQNITGGSNWINFTSGGNLVASINPMGQNMGNTTVSAYFNLTGVVRFDQNQYYLDRNIVINPTNTLTDSVLVRFYYTDQEATAMVNATNCPTCTNITDAFVPGVTKFSGNSSIENGTLADNKSGGYQFIIPANVDVVPFGNGYYAEFKVKNFSEFWINGGGAGFNMPLPLTLLNFSGNKKYPDVDLQWQTENESNTSHFEIERKIDDERQFQFAVKVNAAGNSAQTINYAFKDALALTKGRKFQYRLKMVDADGKYTYSNTITLVHSENDVFIQNVYANNSALLQVIAGNKSGIKSLNIRITNTLGQTMMLMQNNYSDQRVDVSKLPSGIYFIEIKSDAGDSFIQKFMR